VILGASHITLGCDDLDAAVESLSHFGYQADFIDRKVVNDPSKRSILSADYRFHGIGLLRSQTGFPIELVFYQERMPDAFGRFVGVFETTTAARQTRKFASGASLNGMPPSVASKWTTDLVGSPGVPAFISGGERTNSGLRKVVLPVTDLPRARRLWCGVLGFRPKSESGELAELEFASPVAAWRLQLMLVASTGSEARTVLDAQGMACLSLLSSNVDDDVRRAVTGGAELVTDIFTIGINGRDMKVAILTEADGAFVELLQIVR
jgi:hypothetical protein